MPELRGAGRLPRVRPRPRREVRDLIASLRREGKTVFMCSHILSDIEVLCDRVAILKRGKLAHAGYLDELRQKAGESNQVEVLAANAQTAGLQAQLPNAQVYSTPSGVRIVVADESDVDEVLAALRKTGGKLISVQPLRLSLEELFLD